jgi:hypothetical protein
MFNGLADRRWKLITTPRFWWVFTPYKTGGNFRMPIQERQICNLSGVVGLLGGEAFPKGSAIDKPPMQREKHCGLQEHSTRRRRY